MSHMYEVGIGGQSTNFQSLALIDNSSSLTTLVTSASDPSFSGSFVFEDEGDVFQCGRCKKQFNSLPIFMNHKREGCSAETVLKECLPHGKTDHEELPAGHYLTESGHLIASSNSARPYESISASVLSSIGISQQHHDHNHTSGTAECETSLNSNPVIHLTPSIVLGEETLSFTIPVDNNSGLAHLLANTNSSSILSIPENELAALISAGERYHISSNDPSSHLTSNSYYLTASLLPSTSNGKENCSIQVTRNYSVDSPEYVDVSDERLKDGSHLGNAEETNDQADESLQSSSKSVVTVIRLKKGDNCETDVSCQNNESQISQQQKSKNKKPQVHLKNKSPAKDSSASTEKNTTDTPPECKRKCEYCNKTFKKLFNLHQHIRSHTGEKPFHCLVCGRGFTQKSNVKKHMQTHKVWPKVKYTLPKEQISVKVKASTEEPELDGTGNQSQNPDSVEYVVNNVYVCQYCDQHFENYHKLKTHLSHTHKNEKLFKCIHKDCMATFLEVEGLICHMKTHEDQIEYQCQNCPKTFKNLYDLGSHQYTHRLNPNNKVSTAAPKQFRCTKCNSKYASSEALNHHLLMSSHNYPCSQCRLTFVCERYLRRHLRIHGTVEKFKCSVCLKMFKTENYLKSHLVIHSAEKPFHCEICKQSFNRRDKLTRHKLMHDNRKKYKCPYKNTGCEREFYRKDKLKDHMMSHSRKVYVCPKCGKNFSWPIRLRKHQQMYHPEMLTSTTCTVCQKIFKTKHHLKMHTCKEMENEVDKQSLSSENVLTGEESVNKIVVLYNDCEIEDSINSNGEKCENAIMLGSFTQSDDPETVIFARYASSECEDKETCHELEVNEDGVISVMGPMEMTFETGQMDQLITTD